MKQASSVTLKSIDIHHRGMLSLMVLFALVAITTKDFLSVHLETIFDTLGIGQNLAGLTIFTLRNGSSDLFSTITERPQPLVSDF